MDYRAQKILNDWYQKVKAGMVVASVIRADNIDYYWAGSPNRQSVCEPEKTIFEIGSITKGFTGLQLAVELQIGQLFLDDTIEQRLTDFPGPAEFPARLVTIKQLATHNSGLPRLPSNMGFWWLLRYRKDPYAHYDVDHLYRWLATARPKNRLQESAFVYSNAGIAILGQVLALAGNTSFESLLTTQVLSVLGLSDTGFSLDNEQQARLTAGHNRRGTMVSNWHWRVFASAGGLYSTSRDMGRFVSLMLGSIPNPLENEFTAAFQSHRLLSEKQSMGLAWMLDKTEVDLLVWHNGGTGGYRSFVGWYPTLKLGVCVLSSIAVSVDDLAIDLLKSVAI